MYFYLSHMADVTTKLQGRAVDIIAAHQMISAITDTYKSGRALKLRLRAHVYVFKKIRFGVSTRTVHQSGDPVHTDVGGSKETCLHQPLWKPASTWKMCAAPTMLYVGGDGPMQPGVQIAIFSYVSFACQCRSSVFLIHMLVP